MREIIGIFSLLPVITWIFSRKKSRDIASPYNLFTFLYFFNIVIPIILYINIDSKEFLSKIHIKNAVEDNEIYITYVILQTISYYLVVFGMNLKIKSFNPKLMKNYKSFNYLKYKYTGIMLWIIGVLSFFKIMSQVGGIKYFFTHLQFRTILMRNIDFLSWILPFLNYGVLLIVYSHKGNKKPITLKIFMLAILSGLMSGLGGRKALIMLLIEVLLLSHYCVKSINVKKLLKLKYIFLIICIYIFFILMVKFRVEGAVEEFLKNPFLFALNSNEGFLKTIKKESYVAYYMALIKYFQTNSFWKGKTFLGLVTAIIPSSIFPNKPPVDDGTYLYSICLGRTDIMPPMPFNKLNGSSLPLETFGSMYCNFGVIGLFLGMTLLGIVYKYFYQKMKNSSYNFFYVIMYIQVIFTFHLSTLRVFQIFLIMIQLYIITFIVKKLKIKKGRNYEVFKKINLL